MSDNRNIDVQLNLKADDYLAKISQAESVTRSFFNRCYQDADRMTAKMHTVANSLKAISSSRLDIDKDRNIERKMESIVRLNTQLNNLKSTELRIKISGDAQLKGLQNELNKITKDLTNAQTKANEFISALGWKNKPLDLTNARDINRLQKNILGKDMYTTELPQLLAERNKLRSWLGDYQYGLDNYTEKQLAKSFGAKHFDKYQENAMRVSELNTLIQPLQEQQRVFTDARNIALNYQKQQQRISDSEFRTNEKLNANLIAQNKVKDNMLLAERDLIALRESKLSKLNKQELKTEEKFNDLADKRKRLWDRGYDAEQKYYEKQRQNALKQNKQNYIDNTGLKEQISLWGQVERITGIVSSSMRFIGQLAISAAQGLNMFAGFYGGGILQNPVGQLVNAAANKFTSGISGGQTRYDILKTFPKYMEMLGVETEKSNQLLDKMWKNVEGTSIKYDEMVNRAKQYSMILGDAERGTNLAISTERAFLFGGMGEHGARAKSSLDYLISTGEVNRFTQWRTIVTGLGVAGDVIAKKLGYATTRDLLNNMKSDDKNTPPKVTGEMFLNALESINDTAEMDEMAKIYMSTIESVKNTLNNAFNVGWGNIFKSLDEILAKRGTSIHEELDNILLGTKGLFTQLTDWISQNPDAVFDMLDKVKNYDWGGLVTNVGKNAKKFFDIVTTIFTKLPPSWSAFGMTLASPLASVLQSAGLATTIGGRGIKQAGRIGHFIKSGKQAKLTKLKGMPTESFTSSTVAGAKSVTSATTKLGGLASTLSTGVGLTAGFVGVIGEAVAVIWGTGKALESISKMKINKNKLNKNLGDIASLLGKTGVLTMALTGIFGLASSTGIGAVAIGAGELLTAGFYGTMLLGIKAIKEVGEACQTIADLNLSNKDKIKENLVGIGDIIDEITPIMGKVFDDKKRGIGWDIVDIILPGQSVINKVADGLNKKLKSSAFKDIVDAIKQISGIGNDIENAVNNKYLNNQGGRDVALKVLKSSTRFVGEAINAIYDILHDPIYNKQVVKSGGVEINTVTEYLRGQAEFINEDFKKVGPAIEKIVDTGNNILGIKTGFENFDNAKFKEIMGKVSTAISDIEQEFFPESGEPIGSKLKELDLNGDEGGTTWTSLNSIVTGLYNMATNLAILSKYTYDTNTLFTTFDTVITKINEIDDKKTDSAKGKLDSLKESINNLKTAISGFSWQPLVDNFIETNIFWWVEDLTNQFDKLKDSIESIPKNINISVNKVVGRPNDNFVGPMPIYRSKGGFIPKGSDTIPAMLTPGEFVIRRNVAKILGYGVLNKLNNMDLTGAFSSLGFTPKLSYAKNSNNSYNNNASVVQNIYNAPQNYTQRRAGRFVKGLMR